MIGVAARPPIRPRLVTVNVEPDSSSREIEWLRAASVIRRISRAACHRSIASACRTTGTHNPRSVCVAIPFALFLMLDGAKARQRLFWGGCLMLLVLCVVATKSRGGTIGLGCVGFYYWLKSDKKILTGVVASAVVVVILMSAPAMYFERMASILEIDTANGVAVVQPGVTLDVLDKETALHGLVYPVFPGENSASLGGNVATNAGGMRAVKYGVTRHQVLGLTAVLGTGEVIRTGGRFVKATTGYDLTQIIIGSEGEHSYTLDYEL